MWFNPLETGDFITKTLWLNGCLSTTHKLIKVSRKYFFKVSSNSEASASELLQNFLKKCFLVTTYSSIQSHIGV